MKKVFALTALALVAAGTLWAASRGVVSEEFSTLT